MSLFGKGLEFLESDFLYYPCDLALLSEIPESGITPAKGVVRRTSSGVILAEFNGKDALASAVWKSKEVAAGTITFSKSMSSKKKNTEKQVELVGVTVREKSVRGDGEFKVTASVGKVRIIHNSLETKSAIIYAIGCPNLNFHRGTTRDVDAGSVTFERNHSDDVDLGAFRKMTFSADGESRNLSIDYLIIKNKFGTVLFSRGEASSELSNHSPCYLHFIKGDGLYDNDFRRRYLEAVSFVLGKRLVEIGNSTFSIDNQPIIQESRTPYTLNLNKETGLNPLPPAQNILSGTFPSEDCFGVLVERFLDNYTDLDLPAVMWSIWSARLMPIGTQLVSFASAFETLVNAWFESKDSKKNAYLDPIFFEELAGPSIERILNSPISEDLKSTLKNKIMLANQFSIIDKKRRFFEIQKLEFGEIESKTVKARNKYAHGGSINDDDIRKLIIFARCYETLLNRALLAAIGATGVYVDYSSYDFPEREISVKMEGNNFLPHQKSKVGRR